MLSNGILSVSIANEPIRKNGPHKSLFYKRLDITKKLPEFLDKHHDLPIILLILSGKHGLKALATNKMQILSSNNQNMRQNHPLINLDKNIEDFIELKSKHPVRIEPYNFDFDSDEFNSVMKNSRRRSRSKFH